MTAVAFIGFDIAIAIVLLLLLLAGTFGWRLTVTGSFGFRAVLFDDFESLFESQLGEFHFGKGVVDRRNLEIGLHLHDGRVGYIFAFFFDAFLSALFGLLFGRYDDDCFALESAEHRHLPLLSRGVDIGLIEDVVASTLGRDFQQDIQAASAFLDQSLPSDNQ